MDTNRAYRNALIARTYGDPAKREVLVYILGILLSGFMIFSGVLLMNDAKKIHDAYPDQGMVLDNTIGIIEVVLGSLVILYLIFRFFTK
jgi:hypothetical protein